ncbi:MAG: M1 family metallopeptidase [Anaerolineales bacterium]|nr:M1 family metallopeptidase [Anaerolineales bacterium]
MKLRSSFPLLILFVFACSLPTAAQPTATFAPKPTEQATETPTQAPTAETPRIPDHTSYLLDTVIDYDLHRVSVTERIQYPNHTGQELPALTLAIAANLWVDCFHLNEVTVDEIPVTGYALNQHRLDLPLPTPLAPDSVSTVTLRYSLSLPYMDQVHSQRARIFGYSDIQMNLVNWYPFIVPFKDGEWVIREPWSHGEYLVYPIADFDVNLKFTTPENQPIVAASGSAEQKGASTSYTLTNGRAFAISASREFQVSQTQVDNVTVYSYYLPIYKNAGEAAMSASAQALQVFSQRFGKYPHNTLSIVIADFKDSMEFSGLYFHSRSFYDLYDGTVQNYLTMVAVHETGHQWWFEQVANDQAEEAWLDEALTTYSELLYYESVYPDLIPWWWSYRIDFFDPQGKIDIPIYEGQNADTYKAIVYFNGAHFLKDLRERIGDEAFFAFLQDYYSQEKNGIATSDDFFRILNEHTNVNYSDIVHAYFSKR